LIFWLIWSTGWCTIYTLTPTHNRILGYIVNGFYGIFILLCTIAIFQLIRVPNIMGIEKLLKRDYLFTCGSNPYFLCSKFMGTNSHLNITLLWGPSLGWILAIGTAAFSMAAMLTSLSLTSYLSQYTREIHPDLDNTNEPKYASLYTSLGYRNVAVY